ncbi:keratin, type II cytoskeletal 8-like [Stigmatopora nigra]
MSQGRDYSSQSYTPGDSPTRARSYPEKNADKFREKDDMIGLNDKFVRLIEKVKYQEIENKKMETKLKILKDQETYESKIDAVVKQLKEALNDQIEKLLCDQAKLEGELLQNQEEAETTKMRYEDELLKKAELENEFIITKKDADEGHLETVNLTLELEDLLGQLDFVRVGYDEEIKELESHIQNETVLIRENSKQSIDMNEIVETVKSQYGHIAARTREEVDYRNQKKMDVTILKASQHEQEVRDMRREISDMVRLIQRLNGELDALKRKEESLEKDINAAIVEGDGSLEQARKDIGQLEEALRRAKHDLACQIREQQELMDLKLALDIEIATYHKLLEGEERRMDKLLRHSDF